MLAYYYLGLSYYYRGNLEKSKYYNDRMMRGKVEAEFSIVRKMSLNWLLRNETDKQIPKNRSSNSLINRETFHS